MKFSPPAIFSEVADRFNAFLENRQQNEKNMIVVFLFLLLFCVDFFILVRPVINVFTTTIPQIQTEKNRLKDRQEDFGRQEQIHSQWLSARDKSIETDKQFILRSEVPSLLESLSKLAQDSQVKIITLKPSDNSDAGLGFTRIPIRMSASAGAHDLGIFLARLEGGPFFFKVTDLRIVSNASDERRHTVELSVETYAKGG